MYDPDKSKPSGVYSAKSGALYECHNMDYGNNARQGCYWCMNRTHQNPDIDMIFGWLGSTITAMGAKNMTPHKLWDSMPHEVRQNMIANIKASRAANISEADMGHVFKLGTKLMGVKQ
jgi:hypothetical protein